MPSTVDCTIETTVPRDDIAYSAANFGFDSDIELDEESFSTFSADHIDGSLPFIVASPGRYYDASMLAETDRSCPPDA